MKKSILMLAPHDATIDPRINWEAESAAKNFDVVLLGLQNKAHDAPEIESKNGYEIRRKSVRLTKTSRLHFLYLTLCLATKTQAFLLLALYMVLFPALIVCETLLRALIAIAKKGFSIDKKYAISTHLHPPSKKSVKARLVHWILQTKIDFFDLIWYFDYISTITKSFLKEIHSFAKNPDIIHCNDMFSLLTGLIAKQKYHCKVVYDAHEYLPYSDPKAGFIQRFVLRTFEAFLIKKADHVITVNPLLAGILAKDYKLKKVFSLPNAAPFPQNQSKVKYTEVSAIAKGRVKFLYQGNFNACRGIEEILNAWKEIDASEAALFLRGPEGFERDVYINLARSLGVLDKSVYFLKAVPLGDVIVAAGDADIGLIPYKPVLINHTYACPNKLSEYMQAGLMIISDDLKYVKQVLEDGKCGIAYNSRDISSLTKTFRYAIKNKEMRENCKINALTYAKTQFNWQTFYPVLEKLYTQTT